MEIKTYSELGKYITAFKRKKINLLIINSKGGLGKSIALENSLIKEAPLFFSGHITPLSLYIELYKATKEEKDCLVVFDDVDTLLYNKANISLLKQICDTKEVKTVRYSSTSSKLGDIPSEFDTECKITLLTNHMKHPDPNINALFTRALVVNFTPGNDEIITYIETWKNCDKEIMSFLKTLIMFADLNLRIYVKAIELKKLNMDWKNMIVSEVMSNPMFWEFHNLEGKNDEEKIGNFSGSRGTYYKLKKKFSVV